MTMQLEKWDKSENYLFSAIPEHLMKSAAIAIEPQEAAEEMKRRIIALGFNQNTFADYVGVHKATLTKWWIHGAPTYAFRLLDLLEERAISPAWRETRNRPAPTVEDARASLYGPFSAGIDDAISKGWTRAQIAEVLRQIADETDGRVRERERE